MHKIMIETLTEDIKGTYVKPQQGVTSYSNVAVHWEANRICDAGEATHLKCMRLTS